MRSLKTLTCLDVESGNMITKLVSETGVLGQI
jgi:hypothetical protein